MKEHPILFSAPMVRALLAGTKTQTRRVMARQPANVPGKHAPIEPYRNPAGGWNFVLAETGHGTGDPFPCPYGEPGDRLWVREALFTPTNGQTWKRRYHYAADRAPTLIFTDRDKPHTRPSIHMPRRVSRILLEVTEVRVQRLQEISDEDAQAEGARHFPDLPRGPLSHPMAHPCRWSMESPVSTDQCLSTPQMAFANYINKVNGDGTWESNAWVWAVSFKRVNA